MALTPIGTYDPNAEELLKTYPVANGVTVTRGDAVYFSGGRITNATIGSGGRLVGVAQQTVTGNASGTMKAIVTVSPVTIFLADTSAALASTNLGQYFTLTGATGAQQVAVGTASGTTGQVQVIEYGTDLAPATGTKAVVVIAQHAFHQ